SRSAHPPRHHEARPTARRDPRTVPHDRPPDASRIRRADEALRRRYRAARRPQHRRRRHDRFQRPAPPRRGRRDMTAPTPRPVTGERVLVVDDEADIVALVAYHLVKAGYRVSTAATGPEALTAARQERPALIVLDLMLPGASGYDVLEQLRAHE